MGPRNGIKTGRMNVVTRDGRSTGEVAEAWVRLKGGDSHEREDVAEVLKEKVASPPWSALTDSAPEDFERAGAMLLGRVGNAFTLTEWAEEVQAWSLHAPRARKLVRDLVAVANTQDVPEQHEPSGASQLLVERWVQRVRRNGQSALLNASDSYGVDLEMQATRLLMNLWKLYPSDASEGLFSVSKGNYPGRIGGQAYVSRARRKFRPPATRDSTKWVDRLTVPMDFAIRAVSDHRAIGGQFRINGVAVICGPCESPLVTLDGLTKYPAAREKCPQDTY